MGVSGQLTAVYLLTSVFLKVQSQYYENPITQYESKPYVQHTQGYTPSYLPYPYNQPQTYQPHVSTQPNYYISYYNYPAHSFPANAQHMAAYPTQNDYPSYGTNIHKHAVSSSQTYPMSPNGPSKVLNDDSYSNIKTDIIHIELKYFDHYRKYFSLEDNSYPINAIGSTRPSNVIQGNRQLYQPKYIVKTETNGMNLPQVINKHDVQAKTVSFAINPDQRENNIVINLNFVNGEVATVQPDTTTSDDEPPAIPLTTEKVTTTESATGWPW